LGIARGDCHDRCYILFDVQGCSSASSLKAAPPGLCDGCHGISDGWFILRRVHALRPDSVDAGDDWQTEGYGVLAPTVVKPRGFLSNQAERVAQTRPVEKFSLVPSGCDLAPVSRSARNLFTRLNLQFTIDKRPDL
jgi:hypothetical protein